MMLNEFEVRSYGWQELAVLYGPDLMPASAGKRLSKWVGVNPELKAELQGNGWRKGKKMLTPLQVITRVHSRERILPVIQVIIPFPDIKIKDTDRVHFLHFRIKFS